MVTYSIIDENLMTVFPNRILVGLKVLLIATDLRCKFRNHTLIFQPCCGAVFHFGTQCYPHENFIGEYGIPWNMWGAWASYQIRDIVGCACAGNAWERFPCHQLQRKPLVSDPDMHHGTCDTHLPWCMSGALTRGDGENVPGIHSHAQPTILPIWQEAHKVTLMQWKSMWIWHLVRYG